MPKSNANARAYLDLILVNSVISTDTPASGADTYDHFGSTGTTLGKSSTAGNLYFSLHTASPGATGNQSTGEIAYTGYARIAMARGTASIWTFSTPADGFGSQARNTAAVSFQKMTGGAGGIARFWGLGLDLTGAGDLLWYGPLALETAKPFAVIDLPTDATLANNDILCTNTYAANDQVCFIDVPGSAIPAGLTEDTYYYVISTGLTADKFRVSTTQGGSAVDITGEGAGYVAKVLEKNITLNDEPKIEALAAIILER